MKATQAMDRNRHRTDAEYAAMLRGVQRIVEVFVYRKGLLLACSVPRIEATKGEGGYTIASTYAPEVQALLDRYDELMNEQVRQMVLAHGFELPEPAECVDREKQRWGLSDG